MGSNGPANYGQLRYAVDDAARIADVLGNEKYCFDVSRLESEFDRSAVLDRLTTIAKSCRKQDTLIFYFSGHGECRDGELFLLLDTTEPENLALSALPISWIIDTFNHCKAENKLLVLDCCYADAGRNTTFKGGGQPISSQLVSASQRITIEPQNYLALLAGDHLERTQEIKIEYKRSTLHGGFLTTHLYLALTDRFNELDRDKDGKITVDDLKDWLYDQANKYNGEREKDQHIPCPMLRGKAQGPFYLNLQPNLNNNLNELDKDICPYQGLEPFSRKSSYFFCGRENVVEEVKYKLEKSNFIFLAGASGSGKSSVVQAKISPDLERLGWKVLNPIVPWTDPVSKLKIEITQQLFPALNPTQAQEIAQKIESDGLGILADLLNDTSKILIIIDQFEEVFTASSCNKDQQDKFIGILSKFINSSESKLAVIATIRADFIDNCLGDSSLTRIIQNHTIWIPPLQSNEIKEVIVKPADLQGGYKFQSGLPDLIIRDIGSEENFLPLLEFALKELWNLRDKENLEITFEHYKQLGNGQDRQSIDGEGYKLGGVLGALNQRAEEIFTTFNEHEKAWVKRVFVRLVRTGLESRDTRQRQSKKNILELARNDLEDQQLIESVLNKLIRERLIVTDRDPNSGVAWIDLAHEALMDGWIRFSNWRKEDREVRRLLDRLEDEHREWLRHAKDGKFLAGQGLLAQAKEKSLELSTHLYDSLEEFIKESEVAEKNRNLVHSSALEEYKKEAELEIKRYQLEAKERHLELKESQLKFEVELRTKEVELQAFRREADMYKQQSEQLLRIIVEPPKTVIRNYIQEIPERHIINISGNSGEITVGDRIGGDKNLVFQYSRQNLAEAAAEIRQLLEQLSTDYSNNTPTEKMHLGAQVLEEIDKKPELRSRVIQVLKEAGSDALAEAIDHPAVKVVIAGIEGFLHPDESS
ncbi:caspase family protein [Leptolyngbya boryana FACHB-1624]|nr:caspase family protein [Leptolyngbya sp. FACHB-1624]